MIPLSTYSGASLLYKPFATGTRSWVLEIDQPYVGIHVGRVPPEIMRGEEW